MNLPNVLLALRAGFLGLWLLATSACAAEAGPPATQPATPGPAEATSASPPSTERKPSLPQPSPLESPPPQAMLLTGKIVEVSDGNSVTLLAGKELYEISLAGIDAPERDQPAGSAAIQALSQKVLDKTVRVLSLDNGPQKKFRGVLYFNGCVNTQMVREGMAWYDPQSGQSLWLADAERQARLARLGLWAEDNPKPPWEWRREKAAKDQAPLPDAKAASSKRGRASPKPDGPVAPDEAAVSGKKGRRFGPSKTGPPPTDSSQYWLTEASGIRHNSSCRYFKTTKGRFCTPSEGQPCKFCGG